MCEEKWFETDKIRQQVKTSIGLFRDCHQSYFNDCDLLIIDDLGTEIKSSFISSAFFNIINERQSADKSTIISSNLGVSDLMERYSERIASRLAGNYMFLKVIGDDLRCR